MPRFIAIHTVPITEEQLKKLAKEPSKKNAKWISTYCDFKDHFFVCDWDATSVEAVKEALDSVKVPFDKIRPVKVFNVAKADFEL